jgi:N-methylhydantoinase A/oxoprolinase/acetone carboxylase beta subunit
MTELVLGIDTGGTYTDGVLLDFQTRRVLKTTKTITTHHDLQECILKALDGILPEDPATIKLVSISTTLATNAIAEGKGRPVALLLLGYDPDLIQRFSLASNFATGRFEYLDGGHTLNGDEAQPLDLDQLEQTVKRYREEVEAFAVSGYFSPFNPEHELLAERVISNLVDAPVVLGHQLSSKLNSVQRAATASLNAALLSILQNFIQSMHAALTARDIEAPLMIMRGDGALMNGKIASQRPVETVHSGPAASAIGARFLAQQENALVIDIGGTTTDLAIIDGGRVNISERGTSVGAYSTAIRAARVRSIGLGGDSLLDISVEDQLLVGPGRVVPLAYLSQQNEHVARSVRALAHGATRRPSADYLHYWFLNREPTKSLDNPRAQRLIEMLREHPLPLPTILERLEVMHPIQVGGTALIREEIIGRAALTPTDLLHVTGEFAPWDQEAAEIAARFFARLKQVSLEELDALVKRFISERIMEEIVTYITEQSIDRSGYISKPHALGEWLVDESLYGSNPYLGCDIHLKLPIIGIGAPAGIYLPGVAERLGAELILPEHYEVANAVGAVAGSVMSSHEAWVLPSMRGMNIVGFYVQSGEERKRFARIEPAIQYAESKLEAVAREEALRAGAKDVLVEIEKINEGAESYRVRATAIGTPRLGSVD